MHFCHIPLRWPRNSRDRWCPHILRRFRLLGVVVRRFHLLEEVELRHFRFRRFHNHFLLP